MIADTTISSPAVVQPSLPSSVGLPSQAMNGSPAYMWRRGGEIGPLFEACGESRKPSFTGI